MERLARIGVFFLCLLPLVWVLYAATTGGLGPDAAEALMHFTGEWSLRLLAVTLFVAPLRAWTGWSLLIKLRRMLGLYTFFYASLHFFTFLQFYIGWTPTALVEELVERPYITLGFTAWFLMLPLAMTSTRGMQHRLRGNWQRLHRLVYAAAILACLHLVWQARSDVGEALIYSALFFTLLGWRLRRRILKRQRAVIPGT